ncbi:hypothetical protein RJ639_009872 [Escallonia herrerae]|uniref:Uncharacterized protein n=1 Tax=Escallonia herrerae TaxID=1293975 RepID=A0AA89AV30_9ASTE|nr:hypothetical protein RJ639_009872 [Escallonia herrerae]
MAELSRKGMQGLDISNNNHNIRDKGKGQNILIEDEVVCSDSITFEWINAIKGNKPSRSHAEQRRIQKVPMLLRKDEHKTHEYDPLVVSFGPYHHGKKELQLAEKIKPAILRIYISGCGGNAYNDLYNKVLEVIHVARNCYVEGTTEAYTDNEFAEMMLLDGCFLVSIFECIALPAGKEQLMALYEHLGVLATMKLVRDMFLLENQLPYKVLDVLMRVKYEDVGEDIINKFFNLLNSGKMFRSKLKEREEPFHILEMYRTFFLSKVGKPANSLNLEYTPTVITPTGFQDINEHNYMKKISSFPSATELKAKGIYFRPSNTIRFESFCLYGMLELPSRIITSSSKTIFKNMIAYEMCPHNPNDFRITSYISLMKSLVDAPEDVKVLRSAGVLMNSLGSGEDVIKMYDEIGTPVVNSYIFNEVRERIQQHCNSKAKTSLAQLTSEYFSSPWTIIALLATSCLLFFSLLQTYFAMSPPPDKCMETICSYLKKNVRQRFHG